MPPPPPNNKPPTSDGLTKPHGRPPGTRWDAPLEFPPRAAFPRRGPVGGEIGGSRRKRLSSSAESRPFLPFFAHPPDPFMRMYIAVSYGRQQCERLAVSRVNGPPCGCWLRHFMHDRLFLTPLPHPTLVLTFRSKEFNSIAIWSCQCQCDPMEIARDIDAEKEIYQPRARACTKGGHSQGAQTGAGE
jgi:hypothetical protein